MSIPEEKYINGVQYYSFDDFVKSDNEDQIVTIRTIDSLLERGLIFAYFRYDLYLERYNGKKLPDSLAFRMYRGMIVENEMYEYAYKMVFFKRELTPQEIFLSENIGKQTESKKQADLWRELASSLQGRERLAALASACKHEKLSHSEAHDCLWPEEIEKTETQKRSRISKLKPVAQSLADAHGLEMPGWTAK